ncbi:FAD-dependent oxidoreductase [Pectobacteriaceae bacterium CE70]|nr:FAD-dependent oxidoreductase [Pectobacteriaceae bacterium C52]WJV68865.1 FAD-dependent oxidoreductase [Pectobacteriaceae bacterium CE70]WJY12788.1 FAD-dependent oxidoreductase [Pectobacteriaceae bacterium C80]
MKIIVIGAGMIGASLTWELTQAGLSVTLFDASDAGKGTSANSFAWINSHNKPPVAYHRLNASGMQAHRELAERFGHAPWLNLTGCLEWRATDQQQAMKDNLNELQQLNYPAEWISAAQLQQYEPDMQLDGEQGVIGWFPSEGWVDTQQYIRLLLQSSASVGAKIVTGSKVVEVLHEKNVVTGVKTADGHIHSADMTINASGRWSDKPPYINTLATKLAPTTGILISVPAEYAPVKHVLATPLFHCRPDGNGATLICPNEGVYDIDESTPATRVNELAQDILQKASPVWPKLALLKPEHYQARMGIRALPVDGYPIVGPTEGVTGYYTVVTHSGVTLSPLLARLVTQEIVGQTMEALSPYRPQRAY